jgi:hypothetical protein
MPKKKTSKTPSAPAVDRAAACSDLARELADLYSTLQDKWGEAVELIELEQGHNEGMPFETWMDEWWNNHDTHARDLADWMIEVSQRKQRAAEFERQKSEILALMKAAGITELRTDE